MVLWSIVSRPFVRRCFSSALEGEAMCAASRQQAIRKVDRFQIETTAQEMVAVYEAVLSRHKPRAKPLYVRMEKSLQNGSSGLKEKIHGVLS